MWTRLRALMPERRGILAIDDTGFPKQGTHSVGVKRQYCGALGKMGNCQIGVSTALIGALVWPSSCELYLPKEWTDDADRRDAVRVPASVRFREKWRIALAQVREVITAGFAIEAVVADADYGTTTAFRDRARAPGAALCRRDSRAAAMPGCRRQHGVQTARGHRARPAGIAPGAG